MLPGTVGYVYIGASVYEAAAGGGADSTADAVRAVTLVVGAVAAFLAVAFVSWYAPV